MASEAGSGAGGNVRRTLVILSSWTLGCAAFAFGIAAEITQNTYEESIQTSGTDPVGPAPKLGYASVFAAVGSILIPTLTVCIFGHRLYRAVTTKSVVVLVLSWLVAFVGVAVLLVASVADSRKEKMGPDGEEIDQNAPWGSFAAGGVLSLISAALAVTFQLMSFKVSGEDSMHHLASLSTMSSAPV
eukprot:TRINITY_DN4579_c1_g1_i1.p1 TRINITY_DN4579_c1_g1~~TRINITY_DN4579_c1_g1_i1.p1  ORF type:complete len:208 (+),score=31.06 TRINITY_DN4579_c1_g1_i1:64-624(+)